MAMRRPPDLLLRGAFNSTRATGYLYGELTTGWRYSHVRSPPLALAEAATPPEVVAQLSICLATGDAIYTANLVQLGDSHLPSFFFSCHAR